MGDSPSAQPSVSHAPSDTPSSSPTDVPSNSPTASPSPPPFPPPMPPWNMCGCSEYRNGAYGDRYLCVKEEPYQICFPHKGGQNGCPGDMWSCDDSTGLGR